MIRDSKSLMHLDVSSNKITNAGATVLFKALKANKSLHCFILGNAPGQHKNAITPAAFIGCFQALASNLTLKILNLNGTFVGNAGLGWIVKGALRNKSLYSISLGHTNIDGATTPTLLKLVKEISKTHLDVSRNNLKNGVLRG